MKTVPKIRKKLTKKLPKTVHLNFNLLQLQNANVLRTNLTNKQKRVKKKPPMVLPRALLQDPKP